MEFSPKFLIIALLVIVPKNVFCWDTVEMEVFDVVEEVDENFYQLMGISQEATGFEIKKAYRSLSKQLHPDKNDADDAEIKFRQMYAVYETLKDPERRRHYDRILVEGLPDWRSAVYYYRRARKMSMLEIALILTVVISITQYLMAWGSYWDKYRTLEYHTSRKQIKKKKKKPDSIEPPTMEDLEYLLTRPSMLNILPIQICLGTYNLIRYGPSMYKEHKEEVKRREQEKREEQDKEEEEERQRIKLEEEFKARKAQPKRRRQVVIPERQDNRKSNDDGGCILHSPDDHLEAAAAGLLNTGLWTNEEFCELAKLMNKYPGGTVDRWEVIAEHLNRSTYEVTKMAQKVRDKLASGAWLKEQEQSVQTKIKVKTKGTGDTSETSSDAHWNTIQQKSLEKSISSFPKGTDQRWDKIAKQVPDKTAEDCINRYKFLAEKIKKKKEEEKAQKELEEKLKERENNSQNENEEL